MLDPLLFRPSFVQHLDPRGRLLCTVTLAAVISCLHSLAACGIACALGAMLLFLARPQWRPAGQRLLTINVFVLFLWCITPFTTPGTVLAQWGPCHVTREGLYLSLLVSAKVNALAGIFLALVGTMTTAEAGAALARLHCPAKMVALILFAARSIHILTQEWRTLLSAARLRGFRPRTTAHTYHTIASLLGVLLVRSHEHARRAQEAMLLRGFTGQFRSVTVFRAHWYDGVFALAVLLCIAILLLVTYKEVVYA